MVGLLVELGVIVFEKCERFFFMWYWGGFVVSLGNSFYDFEEFFYYWVWKIVNDRGLLNLCYSWENVVMEFENKLLY